MKESTRKALCVFSLVIGLCGVSIMIIGFTKDRIPVSEKDYQEIAVDYFDGQPECGRLIQMEIWKK